MPDKYEKAEIPKGMEHLFERDWNTEGNRIYSYIGPNGQIVNKHISKDDRLYPRRCPVDGCFVVLHDGDPHNYTDCPCCGNDFEPDSIYTPEKFEEDLSKEIKTMETQLAKNRGLLAMLHDPNHPTKLSNINNSLYSN